MKQSMHDISYDGEVVGTVAVIVEPEISTTIAEIHNVMYKWSPAIYKEVYMVLEDIKRNLKEEGYTILATVAPLEDEVRIRKYWRMLGFSTITQIDHMGTPLLYSEMEV